MSKSLPIAVLFLCVVMVPGGMAQLEINLDMNPANNTTGSISIDPSIQISKSGSESARTFDVLLVVTGADQLPLDQGLTGLSADVLFDATDVLDLVGIKELPGDLNFSGELDVSEEVLTTINEFIAEFNDSQRQISDFRDGWLSNPSDPNSGRASGVVLDTDGDDRLGVEETLEVINSFIDQFNGQLPPYWTKDVLTYSAAEDESVEIFDPPACSNAGEKNAGKVDDLTVVLLKRPDRPAGDQFGYRESTAVISTLTFRVKTDAPTGASTFGFAQDGGQAPKYIDAKFESLDTDVHDLTVPSSLPFVDVVE